jgi:NAD-dependent deacetylase
MIKLRPPSSIVVLTGAGISAESGIKTFRDHDGLWENHDIMDVATPDGFRRNPDLVYSFYQERLRSLNDPLVTPNKAHYALKKLEDHFGDRLLLVTQNVDDLHERAGSNQVCHMHGELRKMRCQKTAHVYPMVPALSSQSICPCCQQKGNLRPHIVWFGEMPFYMNEIETALENADLFIAIGTSGLVYPAALFVQIAKTNPRCQTVEINLEQAQNSHHFDFHLLGLASETVESLVQSILSSSPSYPKNNQTS